MTTFKAAFDNIITKLENNFTVLKNKLTLLSEDVNKKALNTDLTTHTGNTTIHITAEERNSWNSKQNLLTSQQLTNISNVVNKADKSEIPTKVSQLTNDSNYATKDEVSAIASTALKRETVDVLPDISEAQANVIYLVPNESDKTGNIKNEYMLINNAWELLGTSEVDLSGYYKINDLDNELTTMFQNGYNNLTELE